MNRADRITGSFWLALSGAVVLGAAIRLLYVLTDDRTVIGGDGYTYHADALRLGAGLGYTTTGFNGIPEPIAHHPPGWVTVLGAVSWLGGRSLEAHQLVGVVIGLGVVVVTGLVGRRYFSARVGAIAALIAAVYPGFWVLEGNILSEPLALLMVGLLTLWCTTCGHGPRWLGAWPREPCVGSSHWRAPSRSRCWSSSSCRSCSGPEP